MIDFCMVLCPSKAVPSAGGGIAWIARACRDLVVTNDRPAHVEVTARKRRGSPLYVREAAPRIRVHNSGSSSPRIKCVLSMAERNMTKPAGDPAAQGLGPWGTPRELAPPALLRRGKSAHQPPDIMLDGDGQPPVALLKNK